jgi:hypothetical protein
MRNKTMRSKIISLICKAVAEETNGQLAGVDRLSFCKDSSQCDERGYIIIHCADDFPEYGRIHYQFTDTEATFRILDWDIKLTIAYRDAVSWAKFDEQVRNYARGCHEWADECCQVVNAYKDGEDVSDWQF